MIYMQNPISKAVVVFSPREAKAVAAYGWVRVVFYHGRWMVKGKRS